MRRARLMIMGTALVLALGVLAGCGSSSKTSSPAATTTPSDGVTVPNGTSGTTVNITVGDTKGLDGPMTLVATPTAVPAGDVTFVVKNAGTIDHEVVVLKTDTAFDKLPIIVYHDEPNRVDEASAVGETGDPHPKAGETRTFTVKNMVAGKYVLVCNLSKHYAMGMRAPFTVT